MENVCYLFCVYSVRETEVGRVKYEGGIKVGSASARSLRALRVRCMRQMTIVPS